MTTKISHSTKIKFHLTKKIPTPPKKFHSTQIISTWAEIFSLDRKNFHFPINQKKFPLKRKHSHSTKNITTQHRFYHSTRPLDTGPKSTLLDGTEVEIWHFLTENKRHIKNYVFVKFAIWQKYDSWTIYSVRKYILDPERVISQPRLVALN